MASKGTAAKSSSGASMSQYDVEVEARLQALEEKVNSSCGSSDERLKALEARFDDLLTRLQDTPGVKSRVGDI